MIDLRGQVALVTGGTRGLGLALGQALAMRGMHIVVTHRWGSVSDLELNAAYSAAGLPPPLLKEADVINPDDTRELLDTIFERFGRLDIFISNVCIAGRGSDFDGLRFRDLRQSLDYSVWPTQQYLTQIEARFGKLPRVTIGMSSDGPDHYYPGYDYVAASKAALEALIAALAPEIGSKSGRIFGLRTRQVDTQSLAQIFSPEIHALLTQRFERFRVAATDMGDAAVALCGGLLDGLHGQVLCADKGAAFHDNFIATLPLWQELHT